MGQLQGKTVVITGGTSGIGLGMAHLFKQEGAQVIATARTPAKQELAKDLIGEACDAIWAYEASDPKAMARAYEEITAQYGKIHALILNAGVGHLMPFEAFDEAAFDQTMATNVKGVFFGVQKALPHLASKASVIVTTSVTNKMADPMTTAYAPSKAAAQKLVEVLAVALREKQIRINALSPGPVHTPIFGKAGLPEDQISGFLAQLAEQSLTGRISRPDELGEAALFLASERSANITGTELVVDGGYSLVA